MNFTHDPFFPRHSFKFFGGGGTPAMPAPPPPPPSTTQVEVTQAKRDTQRNAAAKGGLDSTVLAGSAKKSPAQSGAGTNVLLGGG